MPTIKNLLPALIANPSFSEKQRPVRVRRQANPHRPSLAPALGLRAPGDGLVIVPQTVS